MVAVRGATACGQMIILGSLGGDIGAIMYILPTRQLECIYITWCMVYIYHMCDVCNLTYMHSANSYGLVCCLWACWFVLGSKGWGNASCCVSVYQYAGNKVYIHLIHIHIHKKQNQKTWHGALFHLDMVVVRGPTAWSDGHSWLPGT